MATAPARHGPCRGACACAAPAAQPTIERVAELVRVLEVVTTMCGHVIGVR